jgi:His-Xaa-Ser system protein HxsD
MPDNTRKESQLNECRDCALTVDLSLYCREAILETAYLFTGKYHVNVTTTDEKTATVRFVPKIPGLRQGDVAQDFMNELIDQQLRVRLRRETADIQRMIIAEAFAPLEKPKG